MKIETKFNVGDKVYIIGTNNENIWFIKEVIILGIKIFVNEEDEIDIRYNTKATGENTWINGVYEQNCFSTKAKAQAECDRRNNGLL